MDGLKGLADTLSGEAVNGPADDCAVLPTPDAVHELSELSLLLPVVPGSGDIKDPRDNKTSPLGLLDECEVLSAGVLVGVADPLKEGAPLVA